MSQIKPFMLVEFVEEGKAEPKEKKSIDIVPSNWVLADLKKNLSCKFMQPPYTLDDIQTLEDFVKQRADPPSSWPLYPINVRGYADTYEQALTRIKVLEKEPYAFTTDAEDNKTREKRILTQLRNRNNTDFLKQVLNDGGEDFNEESVSDDEYKIESDDEDDNTGDSTSPKPKKKPKKRKNLSKKAGLKSKKAKTGKSRSNFQSKVVQKNVDIYSTPLLLPTIPEIKPTTSLPASSDSSSSTQSILLSPELSAAIQNILNKLDQLVQKTNNMEKNITRICQKQDALAVAMNQLNINGNSQNNQEPTSTNFMTTIDFVVKYNVILPIPDKDQFQIFEDKLSEPMFLEDFKKLISLCDKGKSVSFSISSILKKFFTRDLAMNSNMALAGSNNKLVLKNTKFAQIIIDSTVDFWKSSQPALTSAMVQSSFGIALSNSKDWNGFRVARIKNNETI